jgi:chromosome segregation ATPase
MNSLNEKFSELTSALESLQQERDVAASKLLEVQQSVIAMRENSVESDMAYQRERDYILAKLNATVEELDTVRALATDLETKLRRKSEELAVSEADMKVLCGVVAELEGQLEEIALASEEDRNDARKKNEEDEDDDEWEEDEDDDDLAILAEEILEKDAEIQQLKSALEVARAQLAASTSGASALALENEQLRMQSKTATKKFSVRIKELKASEEAKSAVIEALSSKIASLEEESRQHSGDSDVTDLRAAVERLQADLAAKTEEAVAATSNVADLKAEVERLQANLTAKTEEA